MKLTILAILLAVCILFIYTSPVESRGGRGGGGRGGGGRGGGGRGGSGRGGSGRGGSGRGGSGRGGSGRGGTRTGSGGSRVSIGGDGFSSGNGTLRNGTIAASIAGGVVAGAILLVGGVVLVGYYIKRQMRRGHFKPNFNKCCCCSIKLKPARKQNIEVNSPDVKGNYEYHNKRVEEECPPPYEQYKQ